MDIKVLKKKIIKKATALTIILAFILGQTVYASNVAGTGASSSNEIDAATYESLVAEQQKALETISQDTGGYESLIGPVGSSSSDSLSSTGGSNTATDTSGSSSIGPGGTTAETSTDTQASEGSTDGTQADTSAAAPSQITIDASVALPEVKSDYAILYDASSGQVLYEKNADTATPPASTAKLMTAFIVLEQYSGYLSSSITFDQSVINSLETGATTAHMSAGDTLTVEQALNAILVGSACDVAAQLATSLAGSEAAFAALMTQRAVALGCTGTNFANATGLNSSSQYTTARDMARIAAAALSNETIRNLIMQPSYTLPATSSRGAYAINNTNHFITGAETAPSGYIGGKTGYTSLAGQCLASMANVNGRLLVAVILHASRPNQYSDTTALYDYGKKLLDAAGVTDSSSSSSSGQATTTTTDTTGTWEQTLDGMKFKKADGTYLVSEWLDLGENTYFFDPNGYVCTGWQRFSDGTYYYFDPNNGGAAVKNKWVTDNGKSYYMSSTGVMATNTVIDGKYRVDESGVFVEVVG